ncbi:uncharacterized protein EURHEDRAFT_406054 [Aspergillus ruber CBS 135680]|uniref:Uncharacterized protein n=1 Tax=Aspergillus ruber (strain CBS 135680) TaxID=1388766 RepID=A0A017S348_ASPRC|nr:uncharacterized protein EURHEDRAFT_406054 [Aspergillus ruber CBS 135680]EYE91392.1 hypothetical protein EURHEDRAFT_406054 [Aspergillus ruber CBS 135680]
MRALCSNVTSSLEETCENYNDTSGIPVSNCTLTLQNEASAWHATGTQISNSIALMVNTTEQPIVYTNATLPVIQRVEAAEANAVNGTEVSKAILNNPTYAATECTLQPIVRSVRASVSRSRYKEDNLAEWTGADAFSQNETAIVGYTFVPNWNESLGVHSGQKFTLSLFSTFTIADFISQLFSGFAAANSMALRFYRNSESESYATTDVIDLLLYGVCAAGEGH